MNCATRAAKSWSALSNGETIDVTNNGEIVATMVPPSASPFERLLPAGQVRPAAKGPVDFLALPCVTSEAGTAEILADLLTDR